jgi:hypothetical protein
MKKLLVGFFIFCFLAIGTQVHAGWISDSVMKEILQLRSNLGAYAAGYSESGYGYNNVSSNSNNDSTFTNDLTPRISYWYGKVNQHVDIASSSWQTDSDGTSGGQLDKLTYCKKFYPNTTSIAEYKAETINTWKDAGNLNNYIGDRKMSYKCVIGDFVPSITVTSPNNGFEAIESGQKIEIRWDSNVAINALVDVYVSDGIHKGAVVRGNNNGALGLIYTLDSSLIPGSNYRAYVSLVSENPVIDSSDNPFTIKAATDTTKPTLRVSLASSTPVTQTITAGSGNVAFVALKITAGSQAVNNLNAIQIASNLSNATKLNNIVVYDGTTKIGSTNYGLTYNGDYYQSWVYLDNKLSIPANNSKVLYITADTSPVGSSNAISGDVRLGVAGWNFDLPGATVSPFGTAIYGNIITINSSSIDNGCSNGQVYSSTTGATCGNTQASSIKVLSPNGGEIYKVGDNIKVEWNSNNLPDNSAVTIALVDKQGSNYYLVDGMCSAQKPCINIHNGYFDINIPGTILPGLYKVRVVCNVSGSDRACSSSGFEDFSDNYFTINSSSVDNGCSNGEVYSSTNGQLCLGFDRGCNGTNFSSTTGQRCPASTITIDTGCNGSRYSMMTGKYCLNYNGSDLNNVNNQNNNPTPIRRTLKPGLIGDDVKTLQQFLGIYADGVFGRGTAQKVKNWQAQNGLNADGSFGFLSRQKANLAQ